MPASAAPLTVELCLHASVQGRDADPRTRAAWAAETACRAAAGIHRRVADPRPVVVGALAATAADADRRPASAEVVAQRVAAALSRLPDVPIAQAASVRLERPVPEDGAQTAGQSSLSARGAARRVAPASSAAAPSASSASALRF